MTEPSSTPITAATFAAPERSPFDGMECLRCQERGVVVVVDDWIVKCADCDHEYDLEELTKQFSLWEKLARWLRLAKDA